MVAPRTETTPEAEVCRCASCEKLHIDALFAALDAKRAQIRAERRRVKLRFFIQFAGIGAVVLLITALAVWRVMGW